MCLNPKLRRNDEALTCSEDKAYDQLCQTLEIQSNSDRERSPPGERGPVADQSISCPSCGKKIPLTRALRAEIEASLQQQFDETLQGRERELRAKYESRLEEDLLRAQTDAAKKAEKKVAQELAGLKNQVKDQAKDLEEARRLELSMRKRERELERKQQELELTVAREIDKERTRLVTETQERLADEHRLKDAEKERQLGDMRRQIEDLKRKAEQGSQQLQGEAGEGELESLLRANFPSDEIQRDRSGRPWRRRAPGGRRRARKKERRDPVGVQEHPELERRLDREAETGSAIAARGRRGPRVGNLAEGLRQVCAHRRRAGDRFRLCRRSGRRSCGSTSVSSRRRGAQRSARKKAWSCCIGICRVSSSGNASRPLSRRSPRCDTTWTRSAGRPSGSGRAARVRLMRSPSTSPGCTATCKGWFLPCRRSRSSSCLRRRSRFWPHHSGAVVSPTLKQRRNLATLSTDG